MKKILKYVFLLIVTFFIVVMVITNALHYTSKFSGGGSEGKMLDRVVVDFPMDSVLEKSDINDDGYMDLIVGYHSNELHRIEVLINDFGKGFVEKTDDYFLDEVTAYSPLIRAGDFNKDGIHDFVIFDSGPGIGYEDHGGGFVGGSPSFLLSNNAHTWSKSEALVNTVIEANNMCAPYCIADQNTLHIKHFSLGDVNNDGFLDIYVESGGGYRQPPAFFFYYTSTGTFEAKYIGDRVLQGKGETDTWRWASGELVDLDGDGSLDLVLGRLQNKSNNQDTMRNMVIFNDGKGQFLEQNIVEFSQPDWNDGWSHVKSMTFGDINGDSSLDVLLIHNRQEHTGRYIQVLINTGERKFIDLTENYLIDQSLTTAESCEGGDPNLSAPTSVSLEDMDSDNDLDIILNGPYFLTRSCMPSAYEYTNAIFEPVGYDRWIDYPERYVGSPISLLDINNDELFDSIFLLSINCGSKLSFGGGDDEFCLDIVVRK